MCVCVLVHLTTTEIFTTPAEPLLSVGEGEDIGGILYCFDLTVPVYDYLNTPETTGPEVLPAPFPYITWKLHQKQVRYLYIEKHTLYTILYTCGGATANNWLGGGRRGRRTIVISAHRCHLSLYRCSVCATYPVLRDEFISVVLFFYFLFLTDKYGTYIYNGITTITNDHCRSR